MSTTNNKRKFDKLNSLEENKKNSPSKKKSKNSSSSKSETSALTTLSMTSKGNLNENLTSILGPLGDIEAAKGDRMRANAYKKAVQTLKFHPTKIGSGKEASKLPGIGKKIALKIDEIIKSGKLAKLDKMVDDPTNQAILKLTSVAGIGPKKAAALVEKGITTIEQLKKEDGLNNHQKIGLKYYNDLASRVPREEIKLLESFVIEKAKSLDSNYKIEVCGSYRRGAKDSGDIDFLLCHPDYTAASLEASKLPTQQQPLVSLLKKEGLIIDEISNGPKKFMGICMLPAHIPVPKSAKNPEGLRRARHIDIRIIPVDQYEAGKLFFTGSDLLNRQMRMVAAEKGFHLSEYQIRPVGSTGIKGDPLPVHCEKDIFDYLGLPYRKPEERNI